MDPRRYYNVIGCQRVPSPKKTVKGAPVMHWAEVKGAFVSSTEITAERGNC